MVVVNFKIAMGASDDGSELSLLISALKGRATATFVVPAGIGSASQPYIPITLKLSR